MDRPSPDVTHLLFDHHLERGDRHRRQRRHLASARRSPLLSHTPNHPGESPLRLTHHAVDRMELNACMHSIGPHPRHGPVEADR